MTIWKRIRKKGEAVLVRVGLVFIPFFTRSFILRTARCLGTLGYYVSKKVNRIGRANLDLAFGDAYTPAEKETILKDSYKTFALALLDGFWFTRKTRERVNKWVRFDTPLMPVLDDRPMLCVTAHLGNWEILGHSMAIQGRPMSSVAAPLSNPWVDRVFQQVREGVGQQMIPQKGAARGMLTVLRRGGKVGLVMDQNTRPSEGGIFVDFFGLPATVSSAAAMLSIRTGAPIYLGFCILQPDGTYLGVSPDTPELTPVTDPADPKAAIHELTQKMTKGIEEVIRAYPSSWAWTYRRWRFYQEPSDAERYPYYAYQVPE